VVEAGRDDAVERPTEVAVGDAGRGLAAGETGLGRAMAGLMVVIRDEDDDDMVVVTFDVVGLGLAGGGSGEPKIAANVVGKLAAETTDCCSSGVFTGVVALESRAVGG
jgi:hypothetical protein